MSFKVLVTVSDVSIVHPEVDPNTLVDDGRTSTVFGCPSEAPEQVVKAAFTRGPLAIAFERRQKLRIKRELTRQGKTEEQIETALAVVTSDRPFLDWFLSLPWDKIIEALLRLILANDAVEDVSSEA